SASMVPSGGGRPSSLSSGSNRSCRAPLELPKSRTWSVSPLSFLAAPWSPARRAHVVGSSELASPGRAQAAEDSYQRFAANVDKILKGTKPSNRCLWWKQLPPLVANRKQLGPPDLRGTTRVRQARSAHHHADSYNRGGHAKKKYGCVHL